MWRLPMRALSGRPSPKQQSGRSPAPAAMLAASTMSSPRAERAPAARRRARSRARKARQAASGCRRWPRRARTRPWRARLRPSCRGDGARAAELCQALARATSKVSGHASSISDGHCVTPSLPRAARAVHAQRKTTRSQGARDATLAFRRLQRWCADNTHAVRTLSMLNVFGPLVTLRWRSSGAAQPQAKAHQQKGPSAFFFAGVVETRKQPKPRSPLARRHHTLLVRLLLLSNARAARKPRVTPPPPNLAYTALVSVCAIAGLRARLSPHTRTQTAALGSDRPCTSRVCARARGDHAAGLNTRAL